MDMGVEWGWTVEVGGQAGWGAKGKTIETTVKHKNKNRNFFIEIKGWKNICHVNTNKNKTDYCNNIKYNRFKIRIIIRNNEGHFVMKRGSITLP